MNPPAIGPRIGPIATTVVRVKNSLAASCGPARSRTPARLITTPAAEEALQEPCRDEDSDRRRAGAHQTDGAVACEAEDQRASSAENVACRSRHDPSERKTDEAR
jgi:hypothetical protein